MTEITVWSRTRVSTQARSQIRAQVECWVDEMLWSRVYLPLQQRRIWSQVFARVFEETDQ